MTNPILTTNPQFFCKLESTPGTAEALVAADACALVVFPEMSPDIEEKENDVVNGSMSPGASRRGYRKDSWTLVFELKGSGTKDTPPEWGPLLQACGYLETTNAAVSVVYTPDPNQKQTITAQVERGGMVYELSGAAGAASIDFLERRVTITLSGKYLAPVAAAATSSPVFDATDPVMDEGIGFTYNSKTPIISALSIDDGAQVAERRDINDTTGYDSFLTTRHVPVVNISLEEDSTEKWEDDAVAGDANAWTLEIGTVTGNILTVAGSKMQFGSPARADESGITIVTMTGKLQDSAAGAKDWMTITQT